MTGGEKAQFSLSSVSQTSIGDAPESGPAVYRDPSDYERSDSFILNGSFLVADRVQVGGRVPWIHSTDRSSLGDIGATVGYELIPEKKYRQIPSKLFGYAVIQLPTGDSIYDNAGSSTQVTGTGFLSGGGGLSFLQRLYKAWDLSGHVEMRKPFPRFDRNPGVEFTSSLGAGFQVIPNLIRIGMRVSPNQRLRTSTSPSSLVWDTSFDGTVFLGSHVLRGAYVDQTLLGPAYNTTLTRSFLLTYQYYWER